MKYHYKYNKALCGKCQILFLHRAQKILLPSEISESTGYSGNLLKVATRSVMKKVKADVLEAKKSEGFPVPAPCTHWLRNKLKTVSDKHNARDVFYPSTKHHMLCKALNMLNATKRGPLPAQRHIN